MNEKEVLQSDSGITLDEWRRKSQQGAVCGIAGCFNPVEVKCPYCGNHYCDEHRWVIATVAHTHLVFY